MKPYGVIVIGGGHAGCEAALSSARMGVLTALITLDFEKIALMPCNPAIGGIGKGHIVREIDALEPVPGPFGNGPAEYYQFPGSPGTIARPTSPRAPSRAYVFFLFH